MLYLAAHTNTDVKTMNEKEAMNWKKSGWVYMERFGRSRGKEKMMHLYCNLENPFLKAQRRQQRNGLTEEKVVNEQLVFKWNTNYTTVFLKVHTHHSEKKSSPCPLSTI